MRRFSGSLAPLQHENFRWYWIALIVELAGTTMSAVALAFAVLAISDSPSALGIVLAAGTAPTMQSITPRLVPRDLLQKAIALQSLSRGALRIVGPTVSALLLATLAVPLVALGVTSG